VLGLVTVAGVFACSDSAGPPVDTESVVTRSHAFRPLSWKPMDAPLQFSVVGDVPEGDWQLDHDILASPYAGAPPLDNYQVSFWALVDETRSVQINWLEKSASGVIEHPYLKFVVPAGSLDKDPSGHDYEYGDSVLITVTVDRSAMVAYFEPSGLTFDNDDPAELQYWYSGAGDDFNGNGTVDKEDAYIEQSLLDLWTTQKSGWAPLWATQSLSEDWFKAGIEHFSGFSVAY
jgi:hypothetical protein